MVEIASMKMEKKRKGGKRKRKEKERGEKKTKEKEKKKKRKRKEKRKKRKKRKDMGEHIDEVGLETKRYPFPAICNLYTCRSAIRSPLSVTYILVGEGIR